MQSIASVSYTHLDVYKRQVPDHAVAVAHARMESKLRVAEMCLYGFDDLSGLFT